MLKTSTSLSLLAWLCALWAILAPLARAQDDNVGIIKVTATQNDAEVYIEDESVGTAPVTRYLQAGEYTLRILRDGYDPFVRRVEVLPNTTVEVFAELRPGGGTVEFVVEPPGATLILNDSEEWPTPVRLKDRAEGTYTYRLEAEGHETFEGTFEFTKGQNLLIRETLPASEGLVSISSNPAGARIRSGSDVLGTTPVTLDTLSPGVHRFLLDLPGHALVAESVDTTGGAKGQVEAYIPRDGVPVTINTGVPGASVMLAGVPIGSGEVVTFKGVERATYDLRITAPSYIPAETTLDISSAKRIDMRAKLRTTGSSSLRRVRPLTSRWTFWTATGVGVAAIAVGGVAAAGALGPDAPRPQGDVVVTFP